MANNIGAVDTTIRNWVSTGNIPEWAKKSISYIVTIEKLKRKEEYLKNDLDEVRNSISFLINFANEKISDKNSKIILSLIVFSSGFNLS